MQTTSPAPAQAASASQQQMAGMVQQRAALDLFLKDTTSQRIPVGVYPWVDGTTIKAVLPQSGLLSLLMVNFQLTFTLAGTVTSGKWAGWPTPAPFGALKNVQFFSNQGVNLRNHSGWDWYRWLRTRYGFDEFGTLNAGSYSSGTNTLLGFGAQTIQPNVNVAAGTYTVNMTLPMPICYNSRASAGLLLLQNNSINYTLQMQLGQLTGGISATGGSNDFFNTLVGTGLSITGVSGSISIDMEILQAVPSIMPPTSMLMTVISSQQPQLLAGTNVVTLPPSDLYTMISSEIINNGAPVAPTNISSPQLVYSTNIQRFTETYLCHMGRYLYDHGLPPTDGTINWDLGIRNGLVDQRDIFDAFNSSEITNLQYKFNLPSTLSITGTNLINTVTESLRYVSQSA